MIVKNTVRNDFFNWLSDGINDEEISLNTSHSFLHMVPKGLLIISPLAFREFAKVTDCSNHMLIIKALHVEEVFIENDKSFLFNIEIRSKRKLKPDKSSLLYGFILSNPEEKLTLNSRLPSVNEFLIDGV